MIRFTLYYIKLIIAFITALFFTSCNLNFNGMETIAHKGDIIKKEISLPSSFNKIKVSNALHVIVSQNAETKVWVEAHENLHEHISVSVEKETLVIKKDKNFKSNSVNTIYVTAPNIEKLKASSAGTIKSFNELKVQELDIEASSAAEIDLHVVAKEIAINASSAAHVNLMGKVVDLEISSSSAATADASKLTSKDAEANASSGATIKINAVNELKLNASSGSSILYYPTANHLETKTSSGGSVKAY